MATGCSTARNRLLAAMEMALHPNPWTTRLRLECVDLAPSQAWPQGDTSPGTSHFTWITGICMHSGVAASGNGMRDD